MLFYKYDFKTFARVARKVINKTSGKSIRQLYSGYLYPELQIYLDITEKLSGIK